MSAPSSARDPFAPCGQELAERLREFGDRGGDGPNSHVLSGPLVVAGRTWVRCGCGWTAEAVSGCPLPVVCAVEEAWVEWQQRTAEDFDRNVRRVIEFGQWQGQLLRDAAAG